MLFVMLLLFRLFRVYEGSYGFFRGLVFYYLLLFMLLYCFIIAYFIYICIIYNTITLIFSFSITISICITHIISKSISITHIINGSVPLLLELGVDEQLEFLFFLVHAGKLLLSRMALIIEEFQADLGGEINALVLANFDNVIALPDERH